MHPRSFVMMNADDIKVLLVARDLLHNVVERGNHDMAVMPFEKARDALRDAMSAIALDPGTPSLTTH